MGKYESAAWIFTSNIFTTFVLIQNYFTPCLIAVYNNPQVYIPTMGLFQLLFLYIPTFIAFYSMYNAIKKEKSNLFIIAIPILFLLFETILCMNSGLRMLTRYTIMAIPPFLLLISIGMNNLKSKTLKCIIAYLLIINILYLICSPMSAVKGYRDLGERPTALILNENKISNNDSIVLALRKNDFDKYIEFNGKKFSILQDFVHKPYAMKQSTDKYTRYMNYVLTQNVNKEFETDFVKQVIAPMHKGDRVFYIWDENYNAYPIKTEEEYRKIPVMTGSISKMNAEAFTICTKYLKLEKGYKLKYYKVFVFTK